MHGAGDRWTIVLFSFNGRWDREWPVQAGRWRCVTQAKRQRDAARRYRRRLVRRDSSVNSGPVPFVAQFGSCGCRRHRTLLVLKRSTPYAARNGRSFSDWEKCGQVTELQAISS